MIDPHHEPTPRDLRQFGWLLVAFFALVAAIVWWRTQSVVAPQVLLGIGLGLGAVYAAVPALRRPIFRGWLWLAFPIGWVISHLLLAGVFFLTVTPIALLMRWVGRDPLDRTLDPDAPSYWEAYDPQGPASRYYHQS